MISEREAEEHGLEQATVWMHPDFPLATQWGSLTYLDWVVRESLRLDDHVKSEPVYRANGDVSLWMEPAEEAPASVGPGITWERWRRCV